MANLPESDSSAGERTSGERLDSWKEIAAYLKRDVTTVQRWEKREGMPVHRHLHDKVGSVYAYRSELDAWAQSRRPPGSPVPVARAPDGNSGQASIGEASDLDVTGPVDGAALQSSAAPASRGRLRRPLLVAAAGAVLVVGAAAAVVRIRLAASENPLADAQHIQLTDFDGIEQAAALSRDGRFAAFQSDRDGRMDVWVTQVGTGQFTNLTRGVVPEIVNPSIRTLGFSPDGTLVTFWARGHSEEGTPGIGIWAVPLLGGQPRPYLEGVAEYDWSADGARLVFHTPGPGDPTYVRDADQSSEARKIFSAPEGLHAHFQVWSPDQAFIYFVQGSLPDRLDIWRVKPAGGTPERITHHESLVSHPVFIDARTLLYLVTDADGFGPRIYSLDVDRRTRQRVSFGVDSYTSLAASSDGRRVVATRASPKRTLWRVPVTGGRVDMSMARRIPLTTGNGSFPRFGPDYLLYVSSKGTSDTLWKLGGGTVTELWSAPEARIIGAPAIRRDGHRVAFSVKRGERTTLYVVNADGSDARALTSELNLHGAPSWAPGDRSLTVAVVVNGTPQLFDVPLDGRRAAPFVADHSVDPVWSPDGDIVAFTGADVGTTFPLRGANRDGTPHRVPALTLTRGARHLAFMPQGRSLVALRGEIRHKNLWLIDLDTGTERQLTDLGPEFELRDFDVSPDGRELVLEQLQEQSDIVLIERGRHALGPDAEDPKGGAQR
jgi:Tol biopolymer transport system component